MSYQEYPPHPDLNNHVRCYWTLAMAPPHSDGGQRVLSEGVEFSFNLGDPMEFVASGQPTSAASRSCVYGPMTKPIRIRPTRRVEIFGVCFRPGGAHPFLSCPAEELVNSYAEIDDLWGSKGVELVDRILDNGLGTRERIEILDRFFLHHLDGNETKDSCMVTALNVVEANKGQLSIDDLAKFVGLSRRQLERRFKERVGVSPKQLSRNLRFKNVFRHLTASPTDTWASTALACGYYDQSHMIRDFKHYAGTSPAVYFAELQAKENFFTGNF